MAVAREAFKRAERKMVIDGEEVEIFEKTVLIRRSTKVVAGGRRFRFNALVVVGDKNGHVGIGYGKAPEVPDAVRKAIEKAKKNIVKVNLRKGTIPHEITEKFKTIKIIMKPAAPGTGIIAGWSARAVLEMAGVKDILCKVYGSRNPLNVVKAAMKALTNLMSYEDVARRSSKAIRQICH